MNSYINISPYPLMTSYADCLWNKLDLVLIQSIQRRREMEDFINAIMKRIEAEQSYAKNIQNVGCMMDKYLSKKTASSFTYSAFKSDHIHRAEQAIILANSLRDQVLKVLREQQMAQHNEWKKLEKQAKKLEKDIQQNTERVIGSKGKLTQMEKEREDQIIASEILKYSCEGNNDKRNKQVAKIRECDKELKDLEAGYKNSAKVYNQFLLSYETDLKKVLTSLEQHQEARLDIQVDSIMKTLVFETAMMRNFDYDISNISQQMETITGKDDVNSFIKENSDNTPKLKQYELTLQQGLLTSVLERMVGKQFKERLDFERNQEVRKYIEGHFKEGVVEEVAGIGIQQKKDFDVIADIVGACWKNKPIAIQLVHGKFKELMKNQTNRSFFQLAFRFYGSHYNLELMEGGYNSALRLFETVVQRSLEDKDIFTIRKVISLIFSHWTMDPPRLSEEELEKIETMSVREDISAPTVKSKRKQLFSGLTHLAVWRNSDFWEGVIVESIQEELLALHSHKQSSVSETRAKQKNIVLSQLASYSHIMIMLGTTPKNVRMSIGRYCRLYNLGEEQNKDLSKTISETWKVYKELHGKDSKPEGQFKKKEERGNNQFRF